MILRFFIFVLAQGITFGGYSQYVFEEPLEEELKRAIDEDECVFFDLSMPAAVWGESGKIISYQQLAVIDNDELRAIRIKYDKYTLNPVLLELLMSDNIHYSWAANLMLYKVNLVDAMMMERYIPNNCEQWELEQRASDIEYWKQRLSR